MVAHYKLRLEFNLGERMEFAECNRCYDTFANEWDFGCAVYEEGHQYDHCWLCDYCYGELFP